MQISKSHRKVSHISDEIAKTDIPLRTSLQKLDHHTNILQKAVENVGFFYPKPKFY